VYRVLPDKKQENINRNRNYLRGILRERCKHVWGEKKLLSGGGSAK